MLECELLPDWSDSKIHLVITRGKLYRQRGGTKASMSVGVEDHLRCHCARLEI